MQHMQFQVFIFIALVINDLINGQAFTLSPIVGTMDISTCGTVYSTNTTDSQRTESYSFTSTLFYENITFTTCGSAFDTTLRLYKFETGVWTDKKSADDGGSCDPQEELMVSDLDPGDYVLELSSFNLNYFGFYTITTQNCNNNCTNNNYANCANCTNCTDNNCANSDNSNQLINNTTHN
eukprot:30895_1